MTKREAGQFFAQSLAIILVGFSSTVLVVMEGLKGVGASPNQQASAIAALSIGMALSGLTLALRSRQPVLTAWSTPGAVLLATAGIGVTFPQAVGAFLLAAVLTILTGLIRPLSSAISKVPASIAAAMMAGVLLRYVIGVPAAALAVPAFVAPMVLCYFALRLYAPAYYMPVVLGLALVAAAISGSFNFSIEPAFLPFEWVQPELELGVLVGIGIPLYLVTMASQNLPGFAVLRAYGFEPDVKQTLTTTGFASAAIAFFGAHAVNLAVITAAMGAGPDAHPDPSKRWKIAFPFATIYIMIGLSAKMVVQIFAALPAHLVTAVAGLALFAPLMSGLTAMLKKEDEVESALLTFLVTASGISIFGVGAAFWGLICGLLLWTAKSTMVKS
jgi:benzoate membrane transport protein